MRKKDIFKMYNVQSSIANNSTWYYCRYANNVIIKLSNIKAGTIYNNRYINNGTKYYIIDDEEEDGDDDDKGDLINCLIL